MRLQKSSSTQDTTKLTVPYVQEGYLQDHYSPNLPRKKSYQQKENQTNRASDEHTDNNKKRINDDNVLKTSDVKIVDNGVKRSYNNNNNNNTKSAKSSELITRAIPNCFTAEKKKLKFSPPPEGTLIIRHQTVNADKSFDNLSNRSNTSNRITRRLLTAMFRGGLKLKERLLVGVSVATVIFTLLLVVDLQMDTGMTGSHLLPSHARVKYGDGQQFNSYRNRILQKTR